MQRQSRPINESVPLADNRREPAEDSVADLLAALEDALIELDEEGRVIWLNRAGEELAGTTSERARGALLESLLSVPSPKGVTELSRLIEPGAEHRSVWQGVVQRGSATPRQVNARLVVTRPPAIGGRAKRLLVVRDVTELESMRRSLEFSARLICLGQLVAGMAHEINNPLAALFGETFVLKETVAQMLKPGATRERWPAVSECITEIEQLLRHVADIVAGLGEFSRAPGRGIQRAYVARAVEWAVRASSPEVRDRGHTVVAVPHLPAVAIDETRLKQVLLNLLLNAAKALDPSKRACNLVRVSAFECSGRVTIEVSDTGSGFSPETAGRMFEPFFTTRSEGEGTGLGLSISASIVESVGGTIEAESSLGHGSTFRVTLPLASPSTSTMPATRPIHDKPSKKARVLLVNSDAGLLSALGKALSLDHHVVPTSSGSAALECIREGGHFDVVVCDLVLSDRTGLCLRADVQRIAPGLAEQFVFLGEGGSRAAELVTASTCPCLPKPVCFDELAAVVTRYAAGDLPASGNLEHSKDERLVR